jgi:hypothetical protein
VLNRLDALLRDHHLDDAAKHFAIQTGQYYLRTAERRMRASLAALSDNDDQATNDLARRMLK